MEEKINEAINYVRNKNKQRVTKKTKTKKKRKLESYFVTNNNNNNNLCIIRDKSPTKVKIITFPKMEWPNSTNEISIIDNPMLTWKKQ